MRLRDWKVKSFLSPDWRQELEAVPFEKRVFVALSVNPEAAGVTSMATTSTLHLSPIRSRTSLTARQSSGTCRLLGNTGVRSCARLEGIYLASVSDRN